MTNRFPLIVDSVSQTIKELPSGDNLDLTGSGAIFDDITVNGDLTVDTNVLFADAANNRVGIGTSSPNSDAKLDVQGGRLYLDASNEFTIRFANGGTAGGFIGTSAANTLNFYNGTGTERMRITSTGNVGIGTSAPNNKAQVSYTSVAAVPSAGAGGHGFAVGDSGFGIAAGALTSGNGYLQATRWDGSATNYNLILQPNGGNVGIGTSSPTADLSVGSATSSSGDVHLRTSKTTFELTPNNSDAGGMDINVGFVAGGQGPLKFSIGGTERMRIDSSGNVLVGTTAVAGSGGTTINVGGYIDTNRGTTSTAGHHIFRNPNGIVGSITTSASATAYNTSSDYRLKEDMQPMVGSVDRLMALKPVNFAWKVDGSRVDGFLAHEAQEVVPEAVTGTKDAVDADGNPEYQGIDQSKIVPLLTAALQEALQKIEALEARITALEA